MEYIIEINKKNIESNKEKFYNIKNKLSKNEILSDEEIEIYLDNYIEKARKILEDVLGINIDEDSLTNRCDLAQKIVGNMLEKDEIKVYPKESTDVFYPTCIGHSFLVCEIQNNYYLVDLTYKQFLTKEKCNEKEFIIKENYILKTPDPGYFINLSDKKSKDLITELVENGYIKLNKENAKIYADSFYKTKTGYNSHTDIPENYYYKELIKENKNYALDEETFKERYGNIL